MRNSFNENILTIFDDFGIVEKLRSNYTKIMISIDWKSRLQQSLPLRDLAAVMKSVASAPSRNPSGAQLLPIVCLPSRRPWAPLGFLEVALAADLITAARSLLGRLP